MAWTCDTRGSLVHRQALYWEVPGFKRGSAFRSSAYKLQGHSQQGLLRDGNHLGGSRGGSSKQIRMASECGPMHPLGFGLNQDQGSLHERVYDHVG